jgi:hypothetical protein
MPLVAPFLLIVFGALFLLNNFGILDWSVWGELWRLWPLIPIAIGLEMILGRRSQVLSPVIMLGVLGVGAAFLFAGGGFHGAGMTLSKQVAVPLDGVKAAELSMQISEGRVSIRSLGREAADVISGTLEYRENQGEPMVGANHKDGTALITINENKKPTFMRNHHTTWDIGLNPQVPFSILLTADGHKADLNLEKLNLSSLDLTLRAHDTTIRFPANAGAMRAMIDGEAEDLDLLIPEGVEARIEVPSLKAFDIDVDDDRFVKNGQAYETKGYSQAANRLTIDLRLRAGHVNVESR